MGVRPRKGDARKVLHGRVLRRTSRGRGERHSDNRKRAELAMLHGDIPVCRSAYHAAEKRPFRLIGVTFELAPARSDLLLSCDRGRHEGSFPECCSRAPDRLRQTAPESRRCGRRTPVAAPSSDRRAPCPETWRRNSDRCSRPETQAGTSSENRGCSVKTWARWRTPSPAHRGFCSRSEYGSKFRW